VSWIDTNGKIDSLETSRVSPLSFGIYSGSSGGSNCTGSGSMVWGWMIISCGCDWGCGGYVGCLVMMVVDVVVSSLGLSWMSIIVWVA
jgi:hypothetical protein